MAGTRLQRGFKESIEGTRTEIKPTAATKESQANAEGPRNISGRMYAKYRRLLAKDSEWRWVVIVLSVMYLLSPVDLIPDVIPVIGWLDDGVIAWILVNELFL
ncbi:hypothetical protein GNI_053230 [Gregarina niphandrodes]|uniref:DUF1232 domain-containing protein n=1 Tax=Gregarina niphandrodes TaxID=110365 RepID=A0A023B976_GRENI|nr:hypothetical protein GNI_053230 [Gregarina niphandrodes]EZG71251.1 hypothetical protein GNI_053230 [Gregarina niphandrodes]|eukprot:XP_011129834.1 hypothetical protein GNI_053230 [Gregarina niphandrodes]